MHNLPFPLLAETVGERFAGAGMTVLIGLVVVFSVLILLTFYFFPLRQGRRPGQNHQEAVRAR